MAWLNVRHRVLGLVLGLMAAVFGNGAEAEGGKGKGVELWSVQPLRVVRPPGGGERLWGKTAIDRFVAAEHSKRGISPAPRAERAVLARRAYLDLIGLPPAPEEMEEFLNDESPDAYERLIERLLNSPHHGERWGRYWLDAVRFAESHGFEQDYDRPHAYHYRDFVIRALNEDLPYDQFVRWQVAGDELAPENPLALMATGFLGAGAFPTQLTEKEFESARYDELDDMAGTIGTAMLGLTVGCARCHDHKFDPIATRDYYRMVSTFANTIRSEIDLDLEPEIFEREFGQWQEQHEKLERQLREYERAEINTKFTAWLEGPVEMPNATWRVLDLAEIKSANGTGFEGLPDGSWAAQGEAPDKDEYTVSVSTTGGPVSAVRIEALADESLPKNGPGRAGNGNFQLTDIRASFPGKENVSFALARATHEQDKEKLSVGAAIDGEPAQTGWAIDKGGVGKSQSAIFTLKDGIEGPTAMTVKIRFGGNAKHSIGRIRVSVTGKADAPVAGGDEVLLSVVEAMAAKDSKALTEKQRDVLKRFFARQDPRWVELDQALRSHAKPKPRLTKVMVASDRFKPMKHHADDRGFPHFYPETHLLQRGDVNQKREKVTQGFLPVLFRGGVSEDRWIQGGEKRTPSEGKEPRAGRRAGRGASAVEELLLRQASRPASNRRVALADWLTDVEHGAGQLLARVMVNRVWHGHFGRGLVATPNDFGTQGEPPTHPELLDWLAADFIAHGWSLKRLHKQIMTSEVYQQSAAFDAADAKLDPDNKYLWRFSPRRLEAEAMRDCILVTAGLLDRRMYGPGTLDPQMRRRSIYFFVKRSQLIPMMVLFDCPEPLVSIGRRSTTTIAPQALLLMNNTQVRESAEAFARRIYSSGRADVAKAYRLAYGRAPTLKEAETADQFFRMQSRRYDEEERENAGFLAVTDFCQALLASNEFVYIP